MNETDRAGEILRRLELTVVRRLDGLLHGDYRGLVPGHGSESGETRPYVPGDDIRRIDWNVSARSLQTHVRDSIADRELETWVLVDRSPSMDFGTALMTKAELAAHAVGAIGFLTARTGNRLGAVELTASGTTVTPARPGRNHLLGILRRLLTPIAESADRSGRSGAATARNPVALTTGLAHLLTPPRRRGLVVIVSDFLPTAGGDDWVRPIQALASRHDALAIEVVDPRERELPPVGVLAVVDPETGRTRDVPTNRRLRERYAVAAADARDRIARDLRSSGAAHLQLATDRDWVQDIVRFVHTRRRLQEAAR